MHVPQSEQARIELAELACVQSQIISPAQHKPIISIVQDTLVGAYLFTRYDNYLTRNECLDILVDTPSFTGKLPEPEIPANATNLPDDFPYWKYPDRTIPLWTGRQIFSMIIPPVNLKKKNSSSSFDDSKQNLVNIEQGIVRSGVFDKSILGQSEQSLIHIIFNEFGQQRTQQFLDDIQNIVTNWVIKSGFSVGIADLIPDMASSQKMKDIINVKKRKVIEIIEHVHKGILENTSGKTVAEEFEMQVTKALNDTTVETGKVALKHLNSSNRMLNMVLSGSKGSEINIGQMIACVGQQNIDNRRVPYGFTDRTLPHFHKYDDGASARGFVESSFMKGLNPTEFFFHAMSGREGLIDTAVKTSDTGYIQRKLIKGMEDARIMTDYTVRNANGTIIQFLYGEDGFDGAKIEKQKMISMGKSDKDINDMYMLQLEPDYLKTIYIDSVVKDIMKHKETLTGKFETHINKIIKDRNYYYEHIFKGTLNEEVFSPINFRRLVENASYQFGSKNGLSDLNPGYVFQKLENLEQNLKITDYYKGNELILVLAHLYLSPRELNKQKINKLAFDYIIATINQQFYSSIAHPGELVGTIAAQSMGEPSEILCARNRQMLYRLPNHLYRKTL